ncbi:MAG: phosphate acetyltransferase [Rhodospirillaceae bacterium]|nr:phosphate acetyltransferase [Rhodospirillaceae bacterium]
MLQTDAYECPPYLLRLAADLPPTPTALVGAHSALPLESAKLGCEQGLLTPVLVGEEAAIRKTADEIDWDLSEIKIVDTKTDTETAETAAALARDGEVAALMKGQIHTDDFMLGILKRESGLRTGRRLTHIFHMTIPGNPRPLMITDGAVNVAPNIDTRLQAAQNAIDLAHALGNETPKVAVLSGTEEAIESMPSSVEAAEIAERAKDEIKGGQIFGPLAFDNAISIEAAKLKKIEHPVAGNADILLVPNIETGNALFKMMVYFMNGCAAGIVLGAKVPVTLTSRADPPEARIASAALANIAAHSGLAGQ